MKGTLLLYFMTVRSSFSDNVEEPSGDNPEVDTEQWWIGPERSFMIHTYALSRDIRIFSMETKDGVEDVFSGITEKNSSDILSRKVRLEFDDCLNREEVEQKFQSVNLEPTVVIEDGAFMFWRLEGTEYRTNSEPPAGFTPAPTKKSSGFFSRLFGKK